VPGPLDFGPHIYYDECGQLVAIQCRVPNRSNPSQGHANDHEIAQTDVVNKGCHVGHVRSDGVVALRRPLTIAVAAQIEREAMVVVTQGKANEVPSVSVQPAAVQEQNGSLPSGAPVELVEAHVSQQHLPALRKRELGDLDVRNPGGELQVIELIEDFSSHLVTMPFPAAAACSR